MKKNVPWYKWPSENVGVINDTVIADKDIDQHDIRTRECKFYSGPL